MNIHCTIYLVKKDINSRPHAHYLWYPTNPSHPLLVLCICKNCHNFVIISRFSCILTKIWKKKECMTTVLDFKKKNKQNLFGLLYNTCIKIVCVFNFRAELSKVGVWWGDGGAACGGSCCCTSPSSPGQMGRQQWQTPAQHWCGETARR